MRNMREFFQPIDLDADEMNVFETSNTSNTSKNDLETDVSLFNESLRNNLANIIEPRDFDPYTNVTKESPATVSKLPFEEKLSKLMERYRAVKEAHSRVPSDPVQRLRKIICHEKVANVLKLNCLKGDYKFVQKYYESKSPLDSKLRENIEKVFGGRRKVQQFINRKEHKWTDLPPSRQETIFLMLIRARRIDSNPTAKQVETQPNQTTEQQNFEVSGSQANYYIDPELDLPVFYDMESKYESQRMQDNASDTHFAGTLSSTPIKVAAPKAPKLRSPTDSPIKNSPIAKAFQRSILKSRQLEEESQLKSPLAKANSPRMDDEPRLIHTDYMKYLGLNNLDELFADDDGGSGEILNGDQNMDADEIHTRKLVLENLDEVTGTNVTHPDNEEISDIFADDFDLAAIDNHEIDEIPSTQSHDRKAAHTIPAPKPNEYQDLSTTGDEGEVKNNLAYSSNKENVNHNNNSIVNMDASAEVMKPRKSLYIGSISDLLGSDGETETEPLPAKTQDETIPKSDSDGTEEYDFDEIIFSSQVIEDKPKAKVKAAEKTDNTDAAFTKRISSLENGTGVLRNAETVHRNISDDMFAMNESNKSNNKSASSAVEKLQHKESDNAIIAHRSGTPPTISKPNSTKSSSLIATSSASFILRAETNPRVKTSSPVSGNSSKDQARAQSPSLFRINSSGLSANSRQKPQPKRSLNNTSPRPATPSHSSLPENESFRQIRSPSALNRRPNLSRLRLGVQKEAPKTPSKQENGESASTPFLTCRPASTTSFRSVQTSSKVPNADDFEVPGLSKLSGFHYKANTYNQSAKSVSINPNDNDQSSTTPDEDEIFVTCTSNNSDRNQSAGQKRKIRKKPRTKPKRKKFHFIDDEAGVSGDDSEDEDEEDYFFTQGPLQDATMWDEGDPDVDMQAKYLQSIR